MKDNQIERAQFESNIRNSAVAIIFLGAIHLIIPSLNIYWGILLIAVGIFSFFVRKKSTIFIFASVLFLAGVFNILAIFLGYTDSTNTKLATFGIVQIVWGLGEFIKYFKLRKIPFHTKSNRVIEICGYIVLVLIFIFYVYMSWIYVPEYTLVKDVDGKQFEIPASKCAEPYVENTNRCCIPNQNYTWLCEDEGQDYEKKLDLALNDNLTSNETIYDRELKMSFETPKDYILIRDTKEGGKKVPYLFEAHFFNEENYTGDSIYITFLDYRDDNLTNENWKQIVNSIKENSPSSDITKNKSSNGYNLSIIESVYYNKEDNSVVYKKRVIFMDYGLSLRFEGVNLGKDYVYEFNNLVNSIQFG